MWLGAPMDENSLPLLSAYVEERGRERERERER